MNKIVKNMFWFYIIIIVLNNVNWNIVVIIYCCIIKIMWNILYVKEMKFGIFRNILLFNLFRILNNFVFWIFNFWNWLILMVM